MRDDGFGSAGEALPDLTNMSYEEYLAAERRRGCHGGFSSGGGGYERPPPFGGKGGRGGPRPGYSAAPPYMEYGVYDHGCSCGGEPSYGCAGNFPPHMPSMGARW